MSGMALNKEFEIFELLRERATFSNTLFSYQ